MADVLLFVHISYQKPLLIATDRKIAGGMNLIQWITFFVGLCSYGDAGDIQANGTLYATGDGEISLNGTVYLSGSPCLAATQYTSSGPQEHYNGFCYWHSNYTYVSWRDAELSCRAAGSHLTSVHSLEELNFLRRLVQGYTDIFWMGLIAKGLFAPYQWSDGTPLDFVNWEDGDAGKQGFRIRSCVSLNPSNGYFIRTSCFERHLYICKAKDELDDETTTGPTSSSTTVTSSNNTATSSTTTALPLVCPDGWRPFGDKCYAAFGLQGGRIETWADANQKCLDMGATLVSIHNEDEQEFLFRMMRGKTDMAWIGFYEVPSDTDRAFHWSDASPVDFTYWDVNQPNNWNDYKEECGNMRFSSPHDGRWNDAHCDHTQPYICQTHIDPKGAKFAQDIDACTVPKGWVKLSSSCYKIFSGTGNDMTWLEAQYFCKDYGGNLVTVRGLKDLSFLRFHLADFQGDFWIGLRNERNNATYAWIRERQQFSHWDRGQPNEFSDQPNCVATKPNGRWLIRSCDENHPFICEVDEGMSTPVPQKPTEGLTCPNNSLKWRDYGSSFCYIIELENRVAWYEAAHICFQEGGFLASFHSIEEVNVIVNQTKDYKDPLYIGLAQTHEGDFIWDDRSVVDFANWQSGQPSSNSQMCVEMLSASGKWNDISCEIPRGYICSVSKVFSNASVVTATTKDIADTGETSTMGLGGILGIVLFLLIAVVVLVGAYCCLYPSKKSFRSLSESELCNADL